MGKRFLFFSVDKKSIQSFSFDLNGFGGPTRRPETDCPTKNTRRVTKTEKTRVRPPDSKTSFREQTPMRRVRQEASNGVFSIIRRVHHTPLRISTKGCFL